MTRTKRNIRSKKKTVKKKLTGAGALGKPPTTKNSSLFKFNPNEPFIGMHVGGKIKHKKKSRKPRKKLHKKTLKNSKLRKGGTFYDIHPGQLDQLQHIGSPGTRGEKVSCSACALNQMEFPEDLVNEVAWAIATGGYDASSMTEIIKKLQRQVFGVDVEVLINYWFRGPRETGGVTVGDEMTARANPFINKEQSINGIEAIIQIMPEGTSALLTMDYQGRPNMGHAVVIAKSINGTPYIIESQNVPVLRDGRSLQGVYRGIPEIKNYFIEMDQVTFFRTWNNSRPYYDDTTGQWKLRQPDLRIQFNPQIPRHLLYLDQAKTLQRNHMVRQGSFTSQPPTAAAAPPPPAPPPPPPPAPPPPPTAPPTAPPLALPPVPLDTRAAALFGTDRPWDHPSTPPRPPRPPRPSTPQKSAPTQPPPVRAGDEDIFGQSFVEPARTQPRRVRAGDEDIFGQSFVESAPPPPPPPPVLAEAGPSYSGRSDSDTNDAILQYGLLNKLATAAFVKAVRYMSQGEWDKAQDVISRAKAEDVENDDAEYDAELLLPSRFEINAVKEAIERGNEKVRDYISKGKWEEALAEVLPPPPDEDASQQEYSLSNFIHTPFIGMHAGGKIKHKKKSRKLRKKLHKKTLKKKV